MTVTRGPERRARAVIGAPDDVQSNVAVDGTTWNRARRSKRPKPGDRGDPRPNRRGRAENVDGRVRVRRRALEKGRWKPDEPVRSTGADHLAHRVTGYLGSREVRRRHRCL